MRLKKNYYYLVAGLPDLLLDEGSQKATVASFKAEFETSLSPQDYALIELLFLKYDNINLLNLLEKKQNDFIKLGNYSRDFLEEQIKDPDQGLLLYLKDFILTHKTGERESSTISWETVLDNRFFDFIQTTKNEFLKSWFEFIMNLQNVATALACRDHKISLENQLMGKNVVTENILRSNAHDFGLAHEFPVVEKILNAWQSNSIIEREKALDLIKWKWIDDKIFFHYFTIEKLAGFLLQLALVERWMELDEETGRLMFDKLLNKLNEGYELPQEFNLQYVKRK